MFFTCFIIGAVGIIVLEAIARWINHGRGGGATVQNATATEPVA